MLSSLFSLFSRSAIPDLYYGTQPKYLDVVSNRTSGGVERLSLRTLIESRCPSLVKEYKPSWWLFKSVEPTIYVCLIRRPPYSGHFQTAYCVAGDFSKIDEVHYER